MGTPVKQMVGDTLEEDWAPVRGGGLAQRTCAEKDYETHINPYNFPQKLVKNKDLPAIVQRVTMSPSSLAIPLSQNLVTPKLSQDWEMRKNSNQKVLLSESTPFSLVAPK